MSQPSLQKQLRDGLILLGVIAAAALFFVWFFSRPSVAGATSNALSGYTYTVESTCPVNVTITTPNGTEQIANVSSGWSKEVGNVSTPQVIAQLTCNGTVTAKIMKGTQEVKRASSTGEYVIAHAY